MFCNNTKSLANKTTNFVNESHLLIWGKLHLGLTWQTAREPSMYLPAFLHFKTWKRSRLVENCEKIKLPVERVDLEKISMLWKDILFYAALRYKTCTHHEVLRKKKFVVKFGFFFKIREILFNFIWTDSMRLWNTLLYCVFWPAFGCCSQNT